MTEFEKIRALIDRAMKKLNRLELTQQNKRVNTLYDKCMDYINDPCKVRWVNPIPLFRTADGFDIYEGDRYFDVYKSCGDKLEYIERPAEVPPTWSGVARFGHKENAQKYIIEHSRKPILRTEDGYDIYNDCDMVYYDSGYGALGMSARTFIESHTSGVEVFKLQSNAEAYIEQNKKQFSKQDILDVIKNKCVGNIMYIRNLKIYFGIK